MLTAAEEFLQTRQIPYRVFIHSQPPQDLAQAAAERGQQITQVIRTLLFRMAKNEFVVVLIPGGYHVHWPTLRHYLGHRRVTLASDEEVLRITGYAPGSVSPLGLPLHLRILVDPGVFAPEEVSLGSGLPGKALILRRDDLIAALGKFELVDLKAIEGGKGFDE
ncbi:MAG: aminoacyl-tRNA deacylase [Thermanaerothrix sp.]|uniref:aminoacyl-tRNA deacylase n=1 Tax=Thermanaerothrix sp. TaxID=2972675 RepID=UPI003C7EC4F8